MELFYEQLDKVRNQCKSGEVTLVMGDLNAKVGEDCSGNVVGHYGRGDIIQDTNTLGKVLGIEQGTK